MGSADGADHYRITVLTTAGSHCRNTLSIDVTGPGSRLFGLVFGGLLRKSLTAENAGFKARAERPGAA